MGTYTRGIGALKEAVDAALLTDKLSKERNWKSAVVYPFSVVRM